MQRIGVLTSGGDSPGMNAAIRAVVRKSVYHGLEVIGIKYGYSGFIGADMFPMNAGTVSDIIQKGGTILHTARSEAFKSPEGRAKAFDNVRRFGLQGLVVIGGEGSYRGAMQFNAECNLPVICIPGTIDNDISGTDFSIGFDTAVNTAVDAIDRIRDTATSHERTFIIEVMGRESGHIALAAGLSGGAESIIIPELTVGLDDICKKTMLGFKQGKQHSIIIVAEGAASSFEVGRQIKEKTGFDTKVTILGHLQRGGSPTSFDRNLASSLGSKAVELLMKGESGKSVGLVCNEVVVKDLNAVLAEKKPIDLEMYNLAEMLSI